MQTIIDFLFLFLGKHLKGYRTLILSVGTLIVGAWSWITGSGLFEFLCGVSSNFAALAVFCNVTEAKFYGIILVVIGAINYLLRKLTDTPMGESGTSNFSVKRVSPIYLVLGVVFFLVLVFVGLPLLFGRLSSLFAWLL